MNQSFNPVQSNPPIACAKSWSGDLHSSLRRHERCEAVDGALSREPNLARAKIGSPNSGSGCGSSSPRLESFFSEDAERAAGCEMALDVESVLDDGVNGQEALS
jgi:hypothetical protein